MILFPSGCDVQSPRTAKGLTLRWLCESVCVCVCEQKPDINSFISVWKGPLRSLQVDAVVIPCSRTLTALGTTSQAVHVAAGPALTEELKRYAE